jgi:hypothetical protein
MVKRFAVFFDRDFFPFEFALFAMEIVYTMPVDTASLGGQYVEKELLAFRLESVLRTNNIRDRGERNIMAESSKVAGVTISFIPRLPERASIVLGDNVPDQAVSLQGLWVSLEGLRCVVAASFRERGILWFEHQEFGVGLLLDLFGKVEVDANGNPLLTWANAGGCVINGRPPTRDPETLKGMYVTERWANGVLGLVNRGIVRVGVERVVRVDGPSGTEASWLPFGYDWQKKRFSIMPHSESVFVALAAPH